MKSFAPALITLAALASAGCSSRDESRDRPATDAAAAGARAPTGAAATAAVTTAAAATGGAAAAAVTTAAARPGGAGGGEGVPLKVVESRSAVHNGFLHITGEVINEGAKAVRKPKIFVRPYDKAGNPIAVDSVPVAVAEDLGRKGQSDALVAAVTWLPPGGRSPFHYRRDVKKLKGEYGRHELEATGLADGGAGYALAVEGLTFTPEKYDSVAARGTLRNTGRTPCRSPEIVLALEAADGKVLAVHNEFAEGYFKKELAPGQTLTFERKNLRTFDRAAVAKLEGFGNCNP